MTQGFYTGPLVSVSDHESLKCEKMLEPVVKSHVTGPVNTSSGERSAGYKVLFVLYKHHKNKRHRKKLSSFKPSSCNMISETQFTLNHS